MAKTIEEIIQLFNGPVIDIEEFKKQFTIEDAKVVDEWKKANPQQGDPIINSFSSHFGEKYFDPKVEQKCKDDVKQHAQEYKDFKPVIENKIDDPSYNDREKSIQFMKTFGPNLEFASTLDKYLLEYDKIVGNAAIENKKNLSYLDRLSSEVSYLDYLGDKTSVGYDKRLSEMQKIVTDLEQEPNFKNAKMAPTNLGNSRVSSVPYELKYNYNAETYLVCISMVHELYKATGITFTDMAKNPEVINENTMEKLINNRVSNLAFSNKPTQAEKAYDFMSDPFKYRITSFKGMYPASLDRYTQYAACVNNEPFLATNTINITHPLTKLYDNIKMPDNFKPDELDNITMTLLRVKENSDLNPLVTRIGLNKLKTCSYKETNKRIDTVKELINSDPKLTEAEKNKREFDFTNKVVAFYSKEKENRGFFDKLFHPFETYALNKKFTEMKNNALTLQEKINSTQKEIVKKPVSIKNTEAVINKETKLEKEVSVEKNKTVVK